MQCLCGGMSRPLGHEIKTLETAREWYGPDFPEGDLPVQLRYERCNGCGRQHIWPWKPWSEIAPWVSF